MYMNELRKELSSLSLTDKLSLIMEYLHDDIHDGNLNEEEVIEHLIQVWKE